jgi:hypothetical protein
MLLPQFFDSPFHVSLSFHKIIERLEEIALDNTAPRHKDVKALLHEIAAHPELRDGITDFSQIKDNAGLISRMLIDLFPPALTSNEIKAVSIPYQGLIFNYTKRFGNILNDAGPSFEINIRDFNDHQFYVASCCMILNQFYGTKLDFTRPLFYDIPTAEGIIKHYRILYNGDFLEVLATDRSRQISEDDIKFLRDNYDDLALWKEKFPPGSWIVKGFAIMTLFDVTVENAVSILKTNLLANIPTPGLQQTLESVFRSIFRIPDIRTGFTAFDKGEDKFSSRIFGQKIQSFLLMDKDESESSKILSKNSYKVLMHEHAYIAVSDINVYSAKYPDNIIAEQLKSKNIQSLILAPIVKDGILLGIIELVSPRINELNSVNANKLEIVMPFLVDTIDRKITEFQNKVEAVIQNNYTTLHPSVNWEFRHEAKKYIYNSNLGLPYSLKEIKFKDVYPLYGEVDISNSSITRNLSVKNDLKNQVNRLILLLEQLHQDKQVSGSEQNLADLRVFVDELSAGIKADTEQNIQHYLEIHIYPLLRQADIASGPLASDIEEYFKHTDSFTGDFYANRRDYEKTLSLINEKLVTIIDERQAGIQQYFPHYYERFKTDGVEHNLYIGTSISPKQNFAFADLERLRLWQLLVTAEMEIEQYRLKDILPYHLGVTSLILVFSSPIAIRFRMDEKHFDIDGAYNIRYEVIKKRIDKAFIKNTRERITMEGKITIVYSKHEDETEYVRYVKLLQSAGILADTIDHFDVEDLQGVAGLKAMRVGVLYDSSNYIPLNFSYDTIYKGLNLNE